LSPIGQYRISHVPASTGKRSKKRKRKDAKLAEESSALQRPPPPHILSSIVVGLNNITRVLEASSQRFPTDVQDPELTSQGDSQSQVRQNEACSSTGQKRNTPDFPAITDRTTSPSSHFSVIFVLSSLPPVLMEHLPQLVATSALAHPELPMTRLVQLRKDCGGRLCTALGLQRVSAIGILDGAPHSKSLLDIVREQVSVIRVPWLQEAKDNQYLPVKIRAVETFGWVAASKNSKAL